MRFLFSVAVLSICYNGTPFLVLKFDDVCMTSSIFLIHHQHLKKSRENGKYTTKTFSCTHFVIFTFWPKVFFFSEMETQNCTAEWRFVSSLGPSLTDCSNMLKDQNSGKCFQER